ncbi:MAG: hypothetical protein M0R51_08620 [Clostridia bacterium]|jgi:hypothetical protein|nr:hypothetical protein [Clostridia bacterium]
MKIQPTTVSLKKQLEYLQAEGKGKYSDPIVYYARGEIYEITKGRSRFKTYHNAVFYMTKEEWDQKIIEIGDRIQLSDKVKFSPHRIRYATYNAEKLKKVDSSLIKQDKNNKPYSEKYAYVYHILAKKGTYTIVEKASENMFYKLGGLNIYIDFDTIGTDKDEWNGTNVLRLDKNEYNMIKNLVGVKTKITCYLHKQKYGNKIVMINIKPEPNINKYLCEIVKLEDDVNVPQETLEDKLAQLEIEATKTQETIKNEEISPN